MRSSSEVRWIRVRNTVGQRTKLSDWHAIVPGIGKDAPPPGVACSTALSGSYQFESDEGVKSKDGKRHVTCIAIAEAWISDLAKGPGPMNPEPEVERLAAPGKGNE
jgi:hypothetical protein